VRTVLVTGGAGFIGSHLCERLLDRGLKVVCLDSFCDDHDPEARRRHAASFAQHPGWTLVEGDVRDAALVASTFRRHGVSAVVHLAGLGGGRASVDRARAVAEVAYLGALNLLESAHRWGAYTFVYGSTSAVYGTTSGAPAAEDATPCRPVSPLGAAAVAAEALGHAYHRLYGVAVTCLRMFTVYGPRQRPGTAVREVADRLAGGARVPCFGDGTSTRDYVHVDDVVAALVAALDAALPYEVINVGSGRATPLAGLIELVAAAMGATARVEALPEQPGDVTSVCADVAKAGRLLGWHAGVALESGLAGFVRWYRGEAVPGVTSRHPG